MRVLILQAGNTYVNLYLGRVSWRGTKSKLTGPEKLSFDGRTATPKRHLMKRVIRWVNSQGDSSTKLMVLPGKKLTPLLVRKLRERTLFGELLQPPYGDPMDALLKFSHKIEQAITPQ